MKKRQRHITVDSAMAYLRSHSMNPEVSVRLPVIASFVQKHRNELVRCPFCTQRIDDVNTHYTKQTAVDVIQIIYDWCKQSGKHEFRSREIKKLLNHTQYANLNHLDRFAGIIYRPMNKWTGKPYSSSYYGMHMERAEGFLVGVIQGPLMITTNRLTKERLVTKSGYVSDFPDTLDLLDGEGNYAPRTLHNEITE